MRFFALISCFIAVFPVFQVSSQGLNLSPPEKYDIILLAPKIDSIRNAVDIEIEFEESQIELATLLALRHYPELRGVKIKVNYKNRLNAPVKASPAIGGIFKPRKKRTYKISINRNSFVDRLPLNEQVGIIGHELAHFVHFHSKSFGGMLVDGIKYITSRKFELDFEKNADKMAIDHGLGWQLYDVRMYLTRDEILDHMEKNGMYLRSYKTTSTK